MSKLEELVPPFELCKLIPKGEFEDSYAIYVYIYGEWLLFPVANCAADIKEKHPYYSAPTLQDIMANTPFINVYINVSKEYTVHRRYGSHCRKYFRDKNGAAAALKLWLELNGIHYEN